MILTTKRDQVLHPTETYRLALTLFVAEAYAHAAAHQMSMCHRKMLERFVIVERGHLVIENGWGHQLYSGLATPREWWRYRKGVFLEATF